jgi:YD repeat-containing protein
MVGAQNGQTIPVLSQVGLADGSVYSFDYNTYGQVYTIHRYAPTTATPSSFPDDYTQLSYVTYDLPRDGSGQQNDCPRFYTRTDWANNWNNNNVVNTTFAGDLNSWGSVTTPDGVTYKEFFGAVGTWQRGLTVRSESWYNKARKKYSTFSWTNDDLTVSYPLRPKLVETDVNDDADNRRRTTTRYTSFSLPSDVYEYGADAATVLRRTHIDYNLSAVYTDRRIIGLPSARYVYDGNGYIYTGGAYNNPDEILAFKITYEYDQNPDPYLQHQGPPVQHDTANYGPDFVQGRGNLNVIRQWDVTDPDKINKSVASTVGYNTSGSVIFSRDPLNHETSMSYSDSFSGGRNNGNTLAYPTTMTDADHHSSTVQYNFDFGAVTRTQDPKGAAVVNIYDRIGRLERSRNEVNSAYTRYVYAPDHLSAQSYTTRNDLISEFYQITVFDGQGRTCGVAMDHPGSAGGYKAQSYEYDIMGRLVRQTNPTEVNGDWEPAGDDDGWVWSSQAYDWQWRKTVSTNQDGTTRSISYEGCGCSGGDVVTLTDEGTLVSGTLQQRKQKIYHDVLGRVVKSESYDWNNNVYTTATQAYNVLDQTTTITSRQGSAGASQVTTFSYDGHGRLSTRQLPSASAPSSFVYNADGMLQTVTDARGASSAFSYNNRHQVTAITYGAPSGVVATPNVTFGYDEAGNQTSMTDGLGSATYHYNTLSRMDWETRVLTGAGSFTINYAYNLSGQLTGVTDPANDTVSYVYNRAGQIAAINGSDYAGVTQYASGFQFRAWGGLKALSYGNGLSLANNYDARLQLQQREVKGLASSGSPSLMKIQYQYYPDGTPKFAQDLLDSRFDRAWTYDQVGRLSEAYTGQEADNYAGVSVQFPQSGPYRHTHQYDVWNNLTSRTGRYWSQTSDFTTTYNGQNQRQGWTYDAAGNVLNDETNQYDYDAAGRNVSAGGVTQAFDGLGQAIKRTGLDNKVTYYLYSRPLGGQLLTELFGTPGQATPVGAKIRGYVYAGGVVVAKQEKSGVNYTNSWVEWEHQDDLTGSLATSRNGTLSNGSFRKKREPDPMGVDVGLSDPVEEPPIIEGGEAQLLDVPGFFPDGRCTLDGVAIGCSMVSSLLDSGAAAVGPRQTTAPIYSKALGKYVGVGIYNPNSGAYESKAEVDKELERTIIMEGQVIGKWRDSIKVPADVRDLTRDGEFIGGGGWFQSKTPEPKGSEKNKKSCGIKRAPEYNVSGTITQGTTFRWRATFLNDETHDPKACEVRQHISWNVAPFGGTSVPHPGFPAGSQPGVWYEDRDEHNTRYGRRTGPYSNLQPGDMYTGNGYSGRDTPGGPGTVTGFQLRFRLVVVDLSDGVKTIYTSRTLTVTF